MMSQKTTRPITLILVPSYYFSKFNFVVGSGFAAVLTKFVQSKFLFDINRIFGSSIVSIFANRTLEYK